MVLKTNCNKISNGIAYLFTVTCLANNSFYHENGFLIQYYNLWVISTTILIIIINLDSKKFQKCISFRILDLVDTLLAGQN